MGKFEASNGATVEQFADSLNVAMRPAESWLEPWAVRALREFFRAERDEELGRWRYPKNPEWVVYPKRPGFKPYNGADLLVVNEVAGASMEYVQADDDGTEYVDRDEPAAKVARAYFEAHPERKPWEDAKTCEVWLLTVDGIESPWTVNNAGVFEDPSSTIELDNRNITAARRIWPENDGSTA